MPTTRDRITTSLLAGALGDALGAPIEFRRLPEIRERFGPDGLTDLTAGSYPLGAITDDTQMTLFTAEGLLRARARDGQGGVGDAVAVVHHSYLRWLLTQGCRATRWEAANGPVEPRGGLMEQRALLANRAPGRTCLEALMATEVLGQFAVNDSKGCGGVMRVAPAAMLGRSLAGGRAGVFGLAADLAHLTHDHPTGYLASGALAAMLADLLDDQPLEQAIAGAMGVLAAHEHHQETTRALEGALEAASRVDRDAGPAELAAEVEALGKGWVAEEALAIGVFCALVSPGDIRRALLLAVNHSGDSDSTGAICGNIVGAMHGPEALPGDWVGRLELRDVIDAVAGALGDVADGKREVGGQGVWALDPGV